MAKNNGGQAFPMSPAVYNTERGFEYASEGMTLRDYIAGNAVQGIFSNPGIVDNTDPSCCEFIARAAYRIADAMIAERDRKEAADAGSPQ